MVSEGTPEDEKKLSTSYWLLPVPSPKIYSIKLAFSN